MTNEEVEKKIVDLIYREPFEPFFVDMADGTSLEITHPRLAIDDSGAGYLGPEGGLVDFEFKTVQAIRAPRDKAVA